MLNSWGDKNPFKAVLHNMTICAIAFLTFLVFIFNDCSAQNIENQKSPTPDPTAPHHDTPQPTPTVIAYAVEINSIPMEAHLFIDDVYRGKTPAKIKVAPERHELRLDKKGYLDVTMILEKDDIFEGNSFTLNLNPVPEPEPADAAHKNATPTPIQSLSSIGRIEAAEPEQNFVRINFYEKGIGGKGDYLELTDRYDNKIALLQILSVDPENEKIADCEIIKIEDDKVIDEKSLVKIRTSDIPSIYRVKPSERWTMIQADPFHSGRIKSDVKQPFTYKLKKRIKFSNAVGFAYDEEQVYLCKKFDNRIYKYDLKSGKRNDKIKINGYIQGIPALYENRTLVATSKGKLYSIDKNDIHRLRFKELPKTGRYNEFTSMIIYRDIAFWGSKNGMLYGVRLNKDDDYMFLKADVGEPVGYSPVIVENDVVCATTEGKIFGVNLDDPGKTWSLKIEDVISGELTAFKDILLIPLESGRIFALNVKERESRKFISKTKIKRKMEIYPISGPITIYEDQVLSCSDNGIITCYELSFKNGNIFAPMRWEEDLENEVAGNSVIVGDYLFVPLKPRGVCCFDLKKEQNLGIVALPYKGNFVSLTGHPGGLLLLTDQFLYFYKIEALKTD